MTDLLARVSAIRDGARARVESDRERNRREMPETARIMDEQMAVFGKPQHLWFTENGRRQEWGTPLQYDRIVQASASPKPGKLLKERRK